MLAKRKGEWMPSHLIPPHGGCLQQLLVGAERAAQLKSESLDWPSCDLDLRQLRDLELLLNGAFSPLTGFMTQADCDSVGSRLRLANDVFWPVPITLEVTAELAADLTPGQHLALRDPEGVMLAAIEVADIWQADAVWRVGGPVRGLELPRHYDFTEWRLGPAAVRERFAKLGWRRVLGCQTDQPLFRPDYERTFRAAREAKANLLVLPIVGMSNVDDADHYTRVRCYRAILPHYPHKLAMFSLLPLAPRPAEARSLLWQALISKNYGCTHFLADPDAADAAAELLAEHQEELGIEVLRPEEMVYLPAGDEYVPASEAPGETPGKTMSAAQLTERLDRGLPIPSWQSFPEVAEELQRAHPSRGKRGFTLFFAGLPSSGKSTIANAVLAKLLEMGGRPVTLLDGDIVRRHLSSELGFSREHRDINILRIGFVASEITKNGGIAICAPIAPYANTRAEVQEMIEAVGGFVLVHVATPLEVCEQRDRKGLYAKARAGIIKEFTGVSDPYEEPDSASLVLDTAEMTPEEAAQEVLLRLEKEGYIGPAL